MKSRVVYWPLCFNIIVFFFLVADSLPGAELRHDRVLGTHDLEGSHGGHGQRESHCGGAQVLDYIISLTLITTFIILSI